MELGQGMRPGWLLGASCQVLSLWAARCAKTPLKGGRVWAVPGSEDQAAPHPGLGFPITKGGC